MAININNVYKTVLLILNQEQRGYITPDEFNKTATQVQLDIFEEYFNDLNQQLRVPQANFDYSNRQLDIDDKISTFKCIGPCAPISAGNPPFNLPIVDTITGKTIVYNDAPTAAQFAFYRIGTLTYKPSSALYSTEIERLQRIDFYNIDKSDLTRPSEGFPVYLYESEKVFVSPPTIVSDITASFLRKPLNVRWGYSIGTLGQYIYDPTIFLPTLLNNGGKLLSYVGLGVTGVIGTYPAVQISSVNPVAFGLVINAVVDTTSTVTFTIATPGTGYVIGDTITVNAGQLGAGSAAVTITLTSADFNSGSTFGSTNFELQSSEQVLVITKILLYSGVIIQDPTIIQVAAQQIQQQEQNSKS